MNAGPSDNAALRRITERVWAHATSRRFRGSDPYDGLQSRLLGPIIRRSRPLRLLTIQAVKRSPLDLRPALLVPAGLNPKGLALFLTGIAEYPALDSATEERVRLEDTMLSLASLPDGAPAFGTREPQAGIASDVAAGRREVPRALGWGYDFAWQSRAFLQPAFYPTVVATSFVVDALAAAKSRCSRSVAGAAARFVSESLHRHEADDGVCFSYSPRDHTRVYNASLFAAKILTAALESNARHAEEWRRLAIKAGDYVASRQRADGAWVYGEAAHWGYVDNLHTGFVLETLDALARRLGVDRWDEAIRRGLDYYRDHLFEADGTARHTDTQRYPLDPHDFAQGAVTFLKLHGRFGGGVDFARAIIGRCIEHLWDERRGGFVFQKHRHYTIRAVHMRWSQAWMFRTLCAYLARTNRA